MLSFASSVASFITSLASRSRNLSFSRKHSAAESANPLLSEPESRELFIEFWNLLLSPLGYHLPSHTARDGRDHRLFVVRSGRWNAIIVRVSSRFASLG